MRRPGAIVAALAALAAVPAIAQSPALPTAAFPPPERRAVALEDGALYSAAEATATLLTDVAAGGIFSYYGETTDAFGRTWSIVGDPNGWTREERWRALPETFARTAAPGDTLAFLTGFGSFEVGERPTATSTTALPADWWREPEKLVIAEPPGMGDLVGVPAYRVPPEVVPELLALLGGRERLGPWPEEPVKGQIHIGKALSLVWFWDDGWSTGRIPRVMSPVLGLLGNPLLSTGSDPVEEQTGPRIPCWTLVGALDATGDDVGRVDEAPDEPDRAPATAREDDPLGATDLTIFGWPVSEEAAVAPRRYEPRDLEGGIRITDESTRQAIYLAQSLGPEVTAELRGRTMRLRAYARAVQSDTATTVPAAIEVEAGSVRERLSVQVGVRATPLELEVTIPEDAERVTVRLLPQDVSIAVAERGEAIFERVSFAPIEWPSDLTPDPLAIRRTLVVGFRQRRVFTRSELAVSERPVEELVAVFPRLGERETELKRHILAGELAPGMSAEEVRLAWGDPAAETAEGELVRWDWAGRSVAFEAGELIAWTTHPEPDPLQGIPEIDCGLGTGALR